MAMAGAVLKKAFLPAGTLDFGVGSGFAVRWPWPRDQPQNGFLANRCAVARNDMVGVGFLFPGAVMLLGDELFILGGRYAAFRRPPARCHPEQGRGTRPVREGSPSLR